MATPMRVAPPPPPIRKGTVMAVEALYNYKAQKAGELTIEEGDLLFILDQSDSNWWKAKLEDKEGMIPSNYVSHNSSRVPIIDAARRGNLCLLQECVSAGVSTNALDKSGSTALHAAAQGGHLECIKELLSTPGVQINLQNKIGDTPLHCASFKGHNEVVKELLKNGANQAIVNKDGETPRSLARRGSVLGEFDAIYKLQKGSSLKSSTYDDQEYGSDQDSD